MTATFDLPAGECAKIAEQARALRVASARAHRAWREYAQAELETRGRYLAAPDGRVLEHLTAPVFVTADGGYTTAINEGDVAGWYLGPGDEPVFLRQPQGGAPTTTAELDELEARQAAKQEARRWEEGRADERLAAEPKAAVTLAACEGRALPTVAGAARRILDVHGTIAERDGRLSFGLPASLAAAPPAELADAIRVLVAARSIVAAAAASGSKQPLDTRLPDQHPGPDGGLA